MKILIASDIHGSATYCRLLTERIKIENPDKILLLGDILYHGPRNNLPDGYNPKEVIELLNPLSDKIISVRGNCDSEVDQMVLSFPVLAEYCLLYWENTVIFATHGHIHNNDTPPEFLKNGILLHGHTHIPCCKKMNEYTYINPGSVSIPKENSTNSYMILEDGKFTWKDINGNEYMNYCI